MCRSAWGATRYIVNPLNYISLHAYEFAGIKSYAKLRRCNRIQRKQYLLGLLMNKNGLIYTEYGATGSKLFFISLESSIQPPNVVVLKCINRVDKPLQEILILHFRIPHPYDASRHKFGQGICPTCRPPNTIYYYFTKSPTS